MLRVRIGNNPSIRATTDVDHEWGMHSELKVRVLSPLPARHITPSDTSAGQIKEGLWTHDVVLPELPSLHKQTAL